MIPKVAAILGKMFTAEKKPKAAFDAGRLAFSNGQDISENPYAKSDSDRTEAWASGWRGAYRSRMQFEAKHFKRETAKRVRKSEHGEEERIKTEELRRNAEDLLRQARVDRESAKRKLEEAEQMRRRAYEEWERIRSEMDGTRQDADPYLILGVHRTDSLDTIKDIYRKLI